MNYCRMQMKTLDFTYSPLPLAERILSIIKRCPNAGTVPHYIRQTVLCRCLYTVHTVITMYPHYRQSIVICSKLKLLNMHGVFFVLIHVHLCI